MHSKPKIEKKLTGIDQSSERASECHQFSTSYLQLAIAHARNNSRVKNENCDQRYLANTVKKGTYKLFKELGF